MWWLVACYCLNCKSMKSESLLRHYFLLITLIFLCFSTVNTTYTLDEHNHLNSIVEDSGKDYILCRFCGADLADAKYIINHPSPKATLISNQTLFERKGVEVQILKNPIGLRFPIITVSESKCLAVGNWQRNHSWYPGYVWKLCLCKQCGFDHGWVFEPVDTAALNIDVFIKKRFYVLKLTNLLSEVFANSLIVVPKSYTN